MRTIKDIKCHIFNVSAKTNWIFISIEDSSGYKAWGEASINGWELILKSTLDYFLDDWIGLSLNEFKDRLNPSSKLPGGLVYNTLISAMTQALVSLMAADEEKSACEIIGSQQRQFIPLYANINRATLERTPQGFVNTTRKAKELGFSKFKLAPFDKLMPNLCSTSEGKKFINHGIDCIQAVRDFIGPEDLLMIDCHWRFDEHTAIKTLNDLLPAKLHWFECPIAENQSNWEATRRIRSAANENGVLLAAAETQVGLDSFQTIFDEKLYDVVMPDVKYCGGPWEMLKIAEKACENGVKFSPHNPSGPICTWHSLQLCLVAPECEMLEIQFAETELYDLLQTKSIPICKNGQLHQPYSPNDLPDLDLELLDGRPYQRVPPGVETILNM
jgi:galactonate dehydratase